MEKFMRIAYLEAIKAYKNGEIPVGAVVVKNNKIISKGKNNRQSKHYLLGHAEINSILKAEKKLKDWRLDGCDLYVTLAPCEMCNFHIKEARIDNVYYLIAQDSTNNKDFCQTKGCTELKEKYKILLQKFFKELRK